MIPVTYGYARVSKSDRDDRNLETQLRELANHGVRKELIFSDVMTGRLMSRPGWDGLMARIQSNDTIALVWLDRFSRNFDEGVRIQADLTSRNIGIVAIKEGIDTTDDSAAAKYFRRMMMANGAYQADSTSERIKVGQERAKAEGRQPGRPPALSPDQVNECKGMFAGNPSVSRVARIMKISWSTANKAIFDESSAQAGICNDRHRPAPLRLSRALRLLRRGLRRRLGNGDRKRDGVSCRWHPAARLPVGR